VENELTIAKRAISIAPPASQCACVQDGTSVVRFSQSASHNLDDVSTDVDVPDGRRKLVVSDVVVDSKPKP
jgi:hypothetical protein